MKLKAGDYVSMKGIKEDEYNAVAKAFIKSGAGIGEYAKGRQKFPFFGWGPSSGSLYHGNGTFQLASGKSQEGCTELSVEQVIGSTEWNGEGLPPIGCEVEATWGCESIWLKSIVLDSNSFAYLNNFTSAWRIEPTNGAKFRQITVKTEAQRLSEAASIKLKTAQKVIDAGYRKESV